MDRIVRGQAAAPCTAPILSPGLKHLAPPASTCKITVNRSDWLSDADTGTVNSNLQAEQKGLAGRVRGSDSVPARSDCKPRECAAPGRLSPRCAGLAWYVLVGAWAAAARSKQRRFLTRDYVRGSLNHAADTRVILMRVICAILARQGVCRLACDSDECLWDMHGARAAAEPRRRVSSLFPCTHACQSTMVYRGINTRVSQQPTCPCQAVTHAYALEEKGA